MNLEPVIGLEIHVQLKTKSKMFCSCDNAGENEPANTTVCPICMGHPGTLPVINSQAIDWGIRAALALNCEVQDDSKFDRKQYFYPDLPKGYQISQFDRPIALGGYLEINIKPSSSAKATEDKQKQAPREHAKIRLTRIHLEEDAAKLLHGADKQSSLVDFNRAGTPLMEIVTEPDLRSPEEAKIFMQELRLMMRYLGISDADMEKGQLRCDGNISLREASSTKLNPKTEIKNVNSFKALERALEYEIARQTKLWEEGVIPQTLSTRGWDDAKQITVEQRTKEEAHDYRYFPEPDLPPLDLRSEKKQLKHALPELPQAKRTRFMAEYDFDYTKAKILTDDLPWADYTEKVISELRAWLISLEEVEGTEKEIWKTHKKELTKLVSDWLINKLNGLMTENKIDIRRLKITPENFAEFITLLYQDKLTARMAVDVLQEMLLTGGDPSQIIEEKGIKQVDDEGELQEMIDTIIKNNPAQATEYKSGKESLLQFFVGQAMKATQGKANPQILQKLLKKKLT